MSLSEITNYTLSTLCPGEQIFKDISKDLQRCGIKRKISEIKCVDDKQQEKLFKDEIRRLKRLRQNVSESNLCIQDLYHAPSATSEQLGPHGPDQNLNQFGTFSRGIYFCDNVKNFETVLKNTEGNTFYRCSVILEGVKKNIDGFNVIYDSRRYLIRHRITLEENGAEEDTESFEKWKCRMHYMVDSCTHEDVGDPDRDAQIRKLEKTNFELRRIEEMESGAPLTEVTYQLLREERKTWNNFKCTERKNYKMPSQQESVHEKCSNIKAKQCSIPDSSTETEDDSTHLAFDEILSKFIESTECGDKELAISIIENQNLNLDGAINEYLSMML